MSKTSTPAASSAASNSPTNDGSTLRQVSDANRARALKQARKARGRAISRAMAGAAGVAGVALAGIAVASQAEARVLPIGTVQAVQGPVTTPAGNVRCKGKGDYHFTAQVPTTGRDSQGHAHAALWIQYPRTGQADLVGFAKSSTRTVTVIGCLTPSRIPGFNGTAIVIAEDITDGYTRPFRVVVPKAAR